MGSWVIAKVGPRNLRFVMMAPCRLSAVILDIPQCSLQAPCSPQSLPVQWLIFHRNLLSCRIGSGNVAAWSAAALPRCRGWPSKFCPLENNWKSSGAPLSGFSLRLLHMCSFILFSLWTRALSSSWPALTAQMKRVPSSIAEKQHGRNWVHEWPLTVEQVTYLGAGWSREGDLSLSVIGTTALSIFFFRVAKPLILSI